VLIRQQRRVQARRLLRDLALQAVGERIERRAHTVVELPLDPGMIDVERVDDVLDEAVAHDVFGMKIDEFDVVHVPEDRLDAHQPRRVGHPQVDLGEVAGDDGARVEPQPGQEHLHLAHGGVLRLVEDHERVRQRAPAHERERRDLDHAHLQEAAHLVVGHQVRERVVHGAQVGVDLLLHVAGQEAQALAGLHRRADEDDAVHLLRAQRRHRRGHGEVGLAGARGADAEHHLVLLQRLQVQRLRRRARAHGLAVERVARRTVVRLGQPHAGLAVPVALVPVVPVAARLPQRRGDVRLLDDLAALGQLDQFLEHAHRRLHLVLVAGHAQRAVAKRDADGDLAFDLADIRVVVPQEGNGVEMLDRELANDHVCAFFWWAPKSAKLLTGEASGEAWSRAPATAVVGARCGFNPVCPGSSVNERSPRGGAWRLGKSRGRSCDAGTVTRAPARVNPQLSRCRWAGYRHPPRAG
jgi:hypothetical protein